jgi:hypothetical protein
MELSEMWMKVLPGLLAALLASAICGCGSKSIPPWGRLSGTVTLDGKPAKTVTVVFENRDKGVCMTATTDDAGRYAMRTAEVAGLFVGDYRVSVLPTFHMVAHEGLGYKEKVKPTANFPVPEKYQDASTSGFAGAIHEGENQVDLEMKSSGRG